MKETIKVILQKIGEIGSVADNQLSEALDIDLDEVRFCLDELDRLKLIVQTKASNFGTNGEAHQVLRLTPKGKLVAIGKILFENENKSSSVYNFHAPVGSVGNQGFQKNVAGEVKGDQIRTQNNFASQETLTAVATEIDKLLDYFEQNDPSLSQAQQIIKIATQEQPEILDAEIIEEAIKSSPTLRQRTGAAGVAAYIETVKLLLPPLGIAIEAYKAYRNPE